MGVWIETDILQERDVSFPSLPVWECGLKRSVTSKEVSPCVSLPVWECGLKPTLLKDYALICVTPRVGVWIETLVKTLIKLLRCVTPRVGVWIETY